MDEGGAVRLLRKLFLFGLAAVLSYWVLLYQPGQPLLPARSTPEEGGAPIELAVEPTVEAQPAQIEAPPVDDPPPVLSAPPPPSPPVAEPTFDAELPPPEVGAPDGEDDEGAAQEPDENEKPERAAAAAASPKEAVPETKPDGAAEEFAQAECTRVEISGFVRSEELVAQAETELSGKSRHGFQSIFESTSRDQFAIAKFFKETVVLVPRAGFNPRAPYYYKLDGVPPEVVKVKQMAPLERFRQYRDFFQYPYQDLPPAVRLLRRQVPNRTDVYLFGALIPPSEWAVVIARRNAALSAYNEQHRGSERALDDVRQFRMDYVPLAGGGFDIRVEEVQFVDGTGWSPPDGSSRREG